MTPPVPPRRDSRLPWVLALVSVVALLCCCVAAAGGAVTVAKGVTDRWAEATSSNGAGLAVRVDEGAAHSTVLVDIEPGWQVDAEGRTVTGVRVRNKIAATESIELRFYFRTEGRLVGEIICTTEVLAEDETGPATCSGAGADLTGIDEIRVRPVRY